MNPNSKLIAKWWLCRTLTPASARLSCYIVALFWILSVWYDTHHVIIIIVINIIVLQSIFKVCCHVADRWRKSVWLMWPVKTDHCQDSAWKLALQMLTTRRQMSVVLCGRLGSPNVVEFRTGVMRYCWNNCYVPLCVVFDTSVIGWITNVWSWLWNIVYSV